MKQLFRLDELLDSFEPFKGRHDKDKSRLFLRQPPTAQEWKAYGAFEQGEVALDKVDHHIRARYGTSYEVWGNPRTIVHNHVKLVALPTEMDVESAEESRVCTEWIVNRDCITQVWYNFGQRRRSTAIDEFLSRRKEDAGHEQLYERQYDEPAHLQYMPLQKGDGIRRTGYYDAVIVPWEYFAGFYSQERFWHLFDRRRNWRKIIEHAVSTHGQQQALHPVPQGQNAAYLHAHGHHPILQGRASDGGR